MRIIYSCSIFLLCLVYVSGDSFCGVVGNLSGVVCLTETKFKLNIALPETYECSTGTVCVNSRSICDEDVKPSCRLSRNCGECLNGALSTCVSNKTYSVCTDGAMTGAIKNCQASRPYCSMRYDDLGVLSTVCNNIIEQIACDGSTMTTTTTAPPTPTPEPTDKPTESPEPADDDCTTLGKFPVKTDPTCKSYLYCYPDKDTKGNDKIGKIIVVCPTDKVYNYISRKCVSGRNFICNNS